jgi:hypothetical protein
MKTQQKHNKMQVKPRAKLTTTKIEPTNFSLPQSHFIEHIANVTEKPPQRALEKLKSFDVATRENRRKLNIAGTTHEM